MLTNSLLLYETLIPLGVNLFQPPSQTVSLTLSVVSVSPVFTITTNIFSKLLHNLLHFP
jgi:hypothetical protein